MTRADLFDMAEQVWTVGLEYIGPDVSSLETFANLVLAAERRAARTEPCDVARGQTSAQDVKYRITPLVVSVHRPTANPVFETGVVHVSIDDDGGGPYLKIEQQGSDLNDLRSWQILLDFEEIEGVAKAAQALIDGYPPKAAEKIQRAEAGG